MGEERIQYARKNIAAGLFSRVISIIVPFVSRTILIRIMGAQYLGLNSLFTSILSVLSLAELGVDSAITYNLYKPIADEDIESVCALLNLYKKVYLIIGFTIFAVGLLCLPFINVLINGAVPEDINLKVLFIIYLLNSTLSYLLFAYKKSLLIALQRTNIVSNISTIIIVFQSVFQILIFYLFKNYYYFASVLIFGTLLSNVLYEIISTKYFGIYQPRGNVGLDQKKVIRKQIGGLMTSKLTLQSRNSFDNIVVSKIASLVSVTVYSNYFYVINSIHGIISSILISIISTIGNITVTESKDRNLKFFFEIQFLYTWLSIWAFSSLFSVLQDFMKIWAGSSLVLPYFTMVLFVIYGFLMAVGDVNGIYTATNGLWWYNRYYTIIEAVINIVLNIFLGLLLGLNGVVIASIVSVVFCNFFYSPYNLCKYYFGSEVYSKIVRYAFKYIFFFCIICFITTGINNCIDVNNTVVVMILKIILNSFVTVFVFIVSNIRNKLAQDSLELVGIILKRHK